MLKTPPPPHLRNSQIYSLEKFLNIHCKNLIDSHAYLIYMTFIYVSIHPSTVESDVYRTQI